MRNGIQVHLQILTYTSKTSSMKAKDHYPEGHITLLLGNNLLLHSRTKSSTWNLFVLYIEP